jgi:drug/metabolite transporter (DMT)-like permease
MEGDKMIGIFSRLSNKQQAILYMVFSALAFSLMGVFVKLTGDIPVVQKTLIRAVVIANISFVLIKFHHIPIFPIHQIKLLTLRSLTGTVAIVMNYYALDHLILSDATVLFRLNTIFVVIFSWVFLQEHISKKQFLMIIIAFIGVIFVVKPELSFEFLPYVVAILGAAGAALSYTMLRKLGEGTHPSVVVFFFAMFTFVSLLPIVIVSYEPMTDAQLMYAILAGISAVGGQYGVTLAYKHAQAKDVSIYNYFGVVFSAIFGLIIFGTQPDAFSVIGYIIIFMSALRMKKIN